MTLDAGERESFVQAWGAILMKSWQDADFRERLHDDPAAVFAEEGLEVQPGAQIKLELAPADATGGDLDHQISLYEQGLETGSYTFYVLEPSEVETREISDRELEAISGAAMCSSCPACSCCFIG